MLIFAANLPKPPWKERVSPKRFPKLKDPNLRQRFSNCIEEKPDEVKGAWASDMDADWNLLLSTTAEITEEVLERPSVTERKNWSDDKCREHASR
jgi:hypothetical protein